MLGILSFVIGTLLVSAPDPETNKVMHGFFGKMLQLQPYMVSSDRFSNPKNWEAIEAHLAGLAKDAENLKKVHKLDNPTYKVSVDFLIDHLKNTRDVYRNGNRDYARRMLNTSLQACGTCHSQVGENAKLNWNIPESSVSGSSFEKAEFWFAVRHYDRALSLYQILVTLYQTDGSSIYELELALQRILSIQLRVRKDVDAAIGSIDLAAQNPNLPKMIQSNLKLWKTSLEKLKKLPTIDPTKSTSEEVLSYVQKVTSETKEKRPTDPEQIALSLYLSGLLYDFINHHPKESVTGRILLQLAIYEDRLNEDYLYTLGDFYLKECIERFHKEEIAKTCLKEYEQKTTIAYTGSQGLRLPKDVEQELSKFRALVNQPKH